jgi:hypothetical protein
MLLHRDLYFAIDELAGETPTLPSPKREPMLAAPKQLFGHRLIFA